MPPTTARGLGCENLVLKVPIRIVLPTPHAPRCLLALSPGLLRGPLLSAAFPRTLSPRLGLFGLGLQHRGKRELLFLFFYGGNVFPPVIHQILLEFNTHQL